MAKLEKGERTWRKQSMHSKGRQQSKLVWKRKENQEICALSSYICMLTYPTEALMEEALNNHKELDYWFHDMQRWSRYLAKRVRLITLGKAIAHIDSFESMKVLIATYCFTRIEEEILFTLEDEGHRVIVREIGPTVQQYFSGLTKHVKANESTSGPPGFEDIEDDHTDEYCSSRHNNDSHRRTEENEAVQESPEVDLRSNLIREDQQPEDNSNASSDARTKTTIFSHNGYSEKVLKISQHLKPLEDTTISLPSGFETDGIIGTNGLVAVYNSKDLE
ncbi:hypothetical protein Cgig2_001297 [Carnegiea gigantea]|uniref:Uncharacterized protein n=1 Tax=Carnegiea gigantea TaxID=171969 RepID=A0A9Q1QLB8_9CARY|nr:hypothetical protein Cgig2_001297 [Carnegiea gigantea]